VPQPFDTAGPGPTVHSTAKARAASERQPADRDEHDEPLELTRSDAESVGSASSREDDARARLLAAAGPVFARRGFDRATVREICGDAGVNIASVGYYFGDKLGLYREVFRAIRNQCHAEHPVPDSAAMLPREELFALVKHLLSRMLACDDSGWESQLMTREMNHPTDVFTEMVEESFRPLFNRLVTTIAALSPAVTPVHVLEQLALSVVGQSLYYRVGAGVVRRLIPADRLAEKFTVESLARHITGVTIAAAENGLASICASEVGLADAEGKSDDHPA
jgi:TetR/AcrR family transcriptional regulator, regulator of cefoperazone and chloramphenicol sensitivity